jgi:hypothetical protein
MWGESLSTVSMSFAMQNLPSINNMFWIGQPSGQSKPIIYSSAKGAVTTENDPDYVAYLAQYFAATPWPKDATGAITAAALDDVLTSYGLPVTGLAAATQAQLLAHVSQKCAALLANMRSYTASGMPALKADASPATLTDLMAFEQDAATTPNDPVSWLANDFSVTMFTASQIAALAPRVGMYRKQVYAAAALAASAVIGGSITTVSQIDAVSWPAS